MLITRSLNRMVKTVLRVKAVNQLLRGARRPIASLLGDRAKYVLPPVGVIDVRLNGYETLRFETNGDDSIVSGLYWDGIDGYERGVLDLYLSYAKTAATVLDVGANTGLYALLAAANNPRASVYAFEPVHRVFTRLQRNVELNRASNVHAVEAAVTDRDGEVIIYVPEGTVTLEASTRKGFRENCVATPVEAVTLDSFVASHGVGRVDLMKIDTEATEHSVLQGAQQLLRRDRPVIICEVLKGRTEQALQSILDGLEYVYACITEHGLNRKATIEGDNSNPNYLFMPKERSDLLPPGLNKTS